MVLDYYRLAEQPFGVTPDTRYLHLSPTHREALASLSYGLQTGRGFMSLIAKPGMGKTTLLFQVLRQLEHSARTVFLFQTLCSPEDLLRSLLHDLGLEDQSGDLVRMHSQLNECLLSESRRGQRLVVVIDEAQNLPDSVLELVRMFSNFETPSDKLMQIILAGQPQLGERLASPNLVQLRQRISIIARLKPFTPEETNLYVGHRLRVAGYDCRAPLFTKRAGAMIAECSEGIPRNINNICFNALSIGCVLKRKTIDEEIIREVLDDLDLAPGTATAGIHRPKIEPDLDVSKPAFYAWEESRGRAWLPKLAAALALLIMLAWPIPGDPGNGRALAPRVSRPTRTDFVVPVSLPSVQDPSRLPDSQAPSTAAANAVAEKPPVTLISGCRAGDCPDTKSQPSKYPKSQAGETTNFPADTNSVELWKQVGKGSTSAVVALAKLYIDGNVVARNCSQAQVLLLAASKSANKSAENLSPDYAKHCH